MDPLQAKANYSRICQLLVDKGGDALRSTFHVMHPPSTLAAVLNANKSVLKKIRYSVITPLQWNLLFPKSGAPDSKNFDITLLTILLRNICGLSAPTTGWNNMPPTGDTSISANILRIKIFRNQVYGHIASPQLNDTKFETLWQEISKPLVNLGIPQQDIDEVKVAPLSPEEEFYIEKLKQWKELEDDILSKLNDVERKVNNVEDEVSRLRMTVENQIPSQTDKLSKLNFTGKIQGLCKKFQHGTRKWFFDELTSWFDDEQSRVMILTAGPGVGKSVLSAKACELYKERGQLAACHFCDFKIYDSSNPDTIVQSLASQMCDNIEGFRDKLTEVLHREHSRNSLPDAYRVLLNEPLHDLDRRERVLIVVDALDESKTETKSDFLELISEKFPELPRWVKILITSRPELQVRKKLQHFNPVEILPDNRHHTNDLKHFFQQCLPDLNEGTVNSLILKCEGSFLYAYFLVIELQNRDLGIEPNIYKIVPEGISGFYEKQFKRLETGLLNFIPDTGSSVLNRFVNIVAASKQSLPIKILFTGMGLSNNAYKVREIIISVMSEILPLYDDCLTVYHKSLWDWLTLDGYEEHAFVANVQDGVEHLWRACKSVYIDIDSLKSVSGFKMTTEKMFALQNGEQYLLDVGDAGDFRWLGQIRLNFLKLKSLHSMNVDISRILKFYRSKRPNLHYWNIIHLKYFSETIRHLQQQSLIPIITFVPDNKQLLIYLQSLANGYFDFMQRSNNGKNEARDILNHSKQMWIEEIGNDYSPQNKVISNVILGADKYIFVRNDYCMALSSDKKFLGYKKKCHVEVFDLPNFIQVFDLKISDLKRLTPGFLLFSPDSSYLLWDSVRFCISLREHKVVPFIPLGPDVIDCCAFSSCGMKLVTFEKNLIKEWDLKQKNILVQVETEMNVEHCLYTECNLYILARPKKQMRAFDIAIFRGTNLERLDIDKISCTGSCLNHEDNYQIISPSRYDASSYSAKFQICHFHLPSGQIFLIANRFCSKPFLWKGRKCVIYFIFCNTVVVYDYILQEWVESFCINCLPGNNLVNDITHLEGTNFFVGLDYNYAFVLSLETSTGFSPDHLVFFHTKIKCGALSPDNLYIACCYENRVLSIQRVDDGEILQIISLARPPEACWWSQTYLWVVCSDLVVKYSYGLTEAGVSEHVLEDCSLNFKKVLKFVDGVLVVCLGDDDETVILKICDQKLCPQQIPGLNFSASSAAISRDGCAVLLYCESNSDYQFWEIACENKWELRTAGKLDGNNEVSWFCLTGEKDSRSSMWLKCMPKLFDEGDFCEYLYVSSIDFPEDKEDFLHELYATDDLQSVVVEGNYLRSKVLIIQRCIWIDFVDISAGSVITSLYVGDFPCVGNVSSFYIPSKRMLVFVGRSEVKFLKIHNIESHLPGLTEN